MKGTILIALIGVLLVSAPGLSMVGGPVFTVGKQMTCMTVEGSQVEMEVPITEGGSDREQMTSRRVFLTGRYGVEENIDLEVKLGAADLTYSDLRFGYSEFSSSPSLAWGGGIRSGFPKGTPYQVTVSLGYLGYRAEATTTSGNKSISSTYLWQEVCPSVTFGYQVGELVPYVGMFRPYLFGSREYSMAFNGQNVSAASGESSFQDGEQDLRGLLGLEYRMPDGYSISGEASTTASGTWILSIGLAQSIR